MARRVFFSFHFDEDIWRVNQVRNSNVVHGVEKAGFYDHSEYEDAQRKGDAGISRMIDNNLKGTSVTVVLIGPETARRKWVKYEIEKSIEQKNGLMGIYIHNLKDHNQQRTYMGMKPDVPYWVEFPCYEWDGDPAKFSRMVEEAGKRSDRLRGV